MIIGGLGGAGFVTVLLALIGAGLHIEVLSIATFSGAVTGYMWEHSRPGGERIAQIAIGIGRHAVTPRRVSRAEIATPRWPPTTIPAGEIRIPPVAFVMTLCVMALTMIVAAGAEGLSIGFPPGLFPAPLPNNARPVSRRAPRRGHRTDLDRR
uniref:Uncharacterized protein n=1 Tax=Phenylobacterium glaciei TaxID=2803784 RepID=A0A974P367_9CAUL|nr:hypothetical protein JKL49_22370 [Phenylobacterium glaciei]